MTDCPVDETRKAANAATATSTTRCDRRDVPSRSPRRHNVTQLTNPARPAAIGASTKANGPPRPHSTSSPAGGAVVDCVRQHHEHGEPPEGRRHGAQREPRLTHPRGQRRRSVGGTGSSWYE